MSKIIDCFIFYNELDLLTYRLNLLNDIVDYFVIVESTHTFIGKEKKLFFNENKHLFENFNKKIIHIIVDDFQYKYPNINILNHHQWLNEKFQRNAISRGINCNNDLSDSDMIIISDLDEIPDPYTLNKIKAGVISVDINTLQMDMYYYNLNTKFKSKWVLCKIISYKKYKTLNINCDDIRNTYCPEILNGGWHLSYFGDKYFIKNKINNFSHQELNNDTYTDLSKIEERVKNNKDLYDRDIDIEKIEIKNNNYLPIEYQKYLKNYYINNTPDSIYLYSRGDRLGSHILQYLSIIIYAFYNNLYIVYEPEKVNYNNEYEYEGTKYNTSFIVKAILNWIDTHNKKFPPKNYLCQYKNFCPMEYLLNFETTFDKNSYFYSCDLLIITTQVLYNIHTDLISYFKKYIRKSMRQDIFNAVPKNYTLPYNPEKTILVHLRMGDVKDRQDYDGSICSNHYKNRIDNDYQSIQGISTLGYCNMQTPLARNKVDLAIMEAKQKYPEHEVIIVTAPGDYEINYPYRCIRSDDESYDMFLLCNADVLILSRSTFSLSAAFLGMANEVWCPLWGHFVCTGLYTKYDNSKFNYFF